MFLINRGERTIFNNQQFRNLIVKPTLEALAHYSPEAENLLVMVMAHESNGGTYLRQVGGPALGIYCMEPETHNDLWKNFLLPKVKRDKSPVDSLIEGISSIMGWTHFIWQRPSSGYLFDLKYATAMARIFFLQIPAPIPSDLVALSEYAKFYWNTPAGKATAHDYLQAYKRFEGISS